MFHFLAPLRKLELHSSRILLECLSKKRASSTQNCFIEENSSIQFQPNLQMYLVLTLEYSLVSKVIHSEKYLRRMCFPLGSQSVHVTLRNNSSDISQECESQLPTQFCKAEVWYQSTISKDATTSQQVAAEEIASLRNTFFKLLVQICFLEESIKSYDLLLEEVSFHSLLDLH